MSLPPVHAGSGAIGRRIELRLSGASYDYTTLDPSNLPQIVNRHPALSGAVTFDAVTDTITLPFHGLAVDEIVMVRGANAPRGIDVNYLYYVGLATTNTIKLGLGLGEVNVPLLTAGGAGCTVQRVKLLDATLADGSAGSRPAKTLVEAWLLYVCDVGTFPVGGDYNLWTSVTSGSTFAESASTFVQPVLDR